MLHNESACKDLFKIENLPDTVEDLYLGIGIQHWVSVGDSLCHDLVSWIKLNKVKSILLSQYFSCNEDFQVQLDNSSKFCKQFEVGCVMTNQ